MKKVSSKILAILLSFAVVLSMMPGMAVAEAFQTGAEDDSFTALLNEVELSDIAIVENAYAYTAYGETEPTVVDLYTITIPEGTKTVDIKFSKDSEAYSYDSDGNYINDGKQPSKTDDGKYSVTIDSKQDGMIDVVQVQNPYVQNNGVWTGGKIRYAITFKTEDFSASVNNKLLYDFNKIDDGYTSYETTVPLYQIKVPEDTTEVKLDFNGNRIAYYYSADGEFIGYNENQDYKTGSNSIIAKVDFSKNYEQEIIQIQYPYGGEHNGELLYAISFITGNESENNQNSSGTSLSKVPIDGVGEAPLLFFDPHGSECMLGNNWYSGNELKANVGDTKSELYDTSNGKYNYMSAVVEIPAIWDDNKVDVKWYYGNVYSADGKNYRLFNADDTNSWKGELPLGYYTPTIDGNNIRYYNIVPDTSVGGTYYYYVDISYTDDLGKTYTLSSKSSQATVIVGNASLPVIPSGQISVSFAVEGFGSLPGLSTHTVSASGGSTAADLVKNQLTSNGYTYEWSSSMGGYLASVTKYGITYSEFTAGPNSGWMYRVNGIAPQIGMSGYTLQEGDEVVLYYTGDYTKDPYSTSGSTQSEPTISITDKDGKDASSMGKVEYDASSNCVDISPSSGYKVSDVKVNGVSKGAVTRLEGIKAADKIEVVFEAEADEPETPAVSDQTAKIIAGVQAIKPKVTNTRLKSGIKVYWKKNSSYKVSYYQVYRKTGKNGTYKLIYTTKLPTTLKITNVKNLKKGKTYYYRVRGVRVIDGKKYYTKWSNYTYRKFR